MSAAGLAQELAATLTGTVTDPSGAVVAGATILVHSDDTAVDTPPVTTTSTGSFNITHLPAGRYTVTVKDAGFETFVAHGVIMNVAETHTLDVRMTAGKVSETMEVTAENAPIQTTTAEQSGTVTGEQVRELALNNRNFEQLVILQPGVSSQLGDEVGFGLNENTTISVNGARAGANNWTVDGADINDSGSNGTITNTPSIDAIQEFTLERSNYDASFGRSGGGQVVVATKSGTSQFHGSVYEFNRNNLYNANNAANKISIAQGAVASVPGQFSTPIERYNDFGFTIGGPLEIPGLYHPVKNKTFFFWSEEWRRASSPQIQTATVPTTQQLGGTFPWVLDTTTGTPNFGLYVNPITVFQPGCVTNTASNSSTPATSTTAQTSTILLATPGCESQNATQYMNAFMAANTANIGGNQLNETFSQLNNFRQDIIRLDQNVGDKVRVFARYMEDNIPENFAYGLWGPTGNYPGVEATATNNPGRNLVVNASASISSRVVNEIEFADTWSAINSSLNKNDIAISPTFLSSLSTSTQKFPDPYGRAPNVVIANYTGLGNGSAPYHMRNGDKNIFDNLSIQHGNHTIRAGVTAAWMYKTENLSGGQAQFNFDNANNSNDPFANFLLGQADSYSQQNRDTTPYLHYMNFEAYVQDDWKLTPRLTVNLGVRYSFFPSPTDSNSTLVNFAPNQYSASLAATQAPINPANGNFAASATGNPATYSNGLIFPAGAECAAAQAIYPGATCSPFGKEVNPNAKNNWGPRFGIAWDPQGNGKWAVRAGYGLFYDRTLNGIWEQNAFFDPPFTQTITTLNNSSSSADLFDNYNVLGAGGAAAPAPNPLTATGTGALNQSPTFKAPSYQDYNVSVQHEIMRNTVFEIGYVGTKGTHLVGDLDINQPCAIQSECPEGVQLRTAAANVGVDVNAIRPYEGYSSITVRAPVYTSNYNSLQVSFNRRLNHGLSFGAAYTWSKLLTTDPVDRSWAATDTYNLKRSYGLSTLNTPQVLILSYTYQEQFFKQQRGLGWLLGGWELTGIANFQTGQSLSVTQNSDPWAEAGYPGGIGMNRGSTTAQILADQVSSNTKGPKTDAQYFNTAAFADTGTVSPHFGTSAPGSILGPGFQRWDTSLIKNVKFGERASLQLRLETFNTFNHTSPQFICGDYSGNSNCNVDSGNFGQVTGWHIPREVQIGGKITF
ncbi:MAG: carboxypeptidase regulatory-like domain-containing protein [Terriglobales bacterium]